VKRLGSLFQSAVVAVTLLVETEPMCFYGDSATEEKVREEPHPARI